MVDGSKTSVEEKPYKLRKQISVLSLIIPLMLLNFLKTCCLSADLKLLLYHFN
jgi:hypothetical protein